MVTIIPINRNSKMFFFRKQIYKNFEGKPETQQRILVGAYEQVFDVFCEVLLFAALPLNNTGYAFTKTPQKWCRTEIENTVFEFVWSKTPNRKITIPHLEQQRESLFAGVCTQVFPFFATNGTLEHFWNTGAISGTKRLRRMKSLPS